MRWSWDRWRSSAARCATCSTSHRGSRGRRHTLYDKDYHGWNGFVAFDAAQRRQPRPADAEFRCGRCGSDPHRVRLHIITEGSSDFLDQAMDGGDDRSQFEEDDWPNAFGYISFDLTCLSCELETKDWATDEAA